MQEWQFRGPSQRMHSLPPQLLRRLDRHPRHLENPLSRNRGRLAISHGRQKGRRAGVLAPILAPQVHAPETRPAEGAQFAEVVQLQHPASGR